MAIRHNVLLSSVGRRSYLIDYFRQSVYGRGKIVVCNSEMNSVVIKTYAGSILSPRVTSQNYISFMREVCCQNDIGLWFSLHDVENMVLSKNLDEISDWGVTPVVSKYDFMKIAFDKQDTFLFLNEAGIASPITHSRLDQVSTSLEQGEFNFPLIVKPRYGFGSSGLFRVDDYSELLTLFHYISKRIDHELIDFLELDGDNPVIVQPLVQGVEYGLEVINDLSGNYYGTFVKEKLNMRAGETDSARIIEDGKLSILGEKLSSVAKHVGILDVDIIRGEDADFIVDLNPRFGGQYPFSHIAGSNLPDFFIKKYEGVECSVAYPRPGVEAYKGIVVVAASISLELDSERDQQ